MKRWTDLRGAMLVTLGTLSLDADGAALQPLEAATAAVASPAGMAIPSDDPLELTVAVYSEMYAAWLPDAQAIAGGLFEDAGIRVAWIACGASEHPACQRPPAGRELVVRIKAQRVDRTSPTCGVALRPSQGVGSYVTLFVDCLVKGSNAFRIDKAVVAGYCLAHEIAHLLLPSSAHAAGGIMQARLGRVEWQRAASGGLRFLAAERQQMADALRSRVAATRERWPRVED